MREVVGLLDEQRDLAQARVGLRPAGTGRASCGGAGACRREPAPDCAGASAADAVGGRGASPFCSRFARRWLFFATRRPPLYAASASAAASRGRRRETTFETPSSPMDTPYSVSAASIVRFWWVTTMNCARSA